MLPFADNKTAKVADLIMERVNCPIDRILVVGCGKGIEAAILADYFGGKVEGIDIKNEFDPIAKTYAGLRIGDAMALDLPDSSIDLVYSYHALEHIEDPIKALCEMSRVLKPGGGYWIGTPNRDRLVGYIGAKEGSVSDKLRWNLDDWKMRMRGKFRNEFGSHAGYSRNELHQMLKVAFGNVTDMTDIYFEKLYSRRRLMLSTICSTGMSRVLYPSVYFCGLNRVD
ncbi:MAG TPA: class I SAM-dependent methyltransferase [Pyrinomonadaceae bacterium]|nr:class I SAM-dependent methyltransferase [Pyrinomonadaceae bacterium]